MQLGTPVVSTNDGQRGVLVPLEDGGIGVKLDRGTGVTNQVIVVPYKENRWVEAPEMRLQSAQIARVAYDADRALMIARGEYGMTEWQTLREADRIAFMHGGPPASDPMRRRLWDSIRKALGA